MTTTRWQFWIDVGGTFTDCLAQHPDGNLRRCKVLSSGVTKGIVKNGTEFQPAEQPVPSSGPAMGTVSAGLGASSLLDPARRHDPNQFWCGYRLRLLDAAGNSTVECKVTAFDSATGRFEITPPPPAGLPAGIAYELDGGEGAPLLAIRRLLGLRLDEPLPPVDVRLGTTRGTNALLTRRGAQTALVTTRGFGDILRIGYQNRPRLFDLTIRKPPPLYAATAEIDERVAADGTVLCEINVDQARAELVRLRDAGIESLAICLLNAYQNAQHEQRLEQLAREVGFSWISRSTAVAPVIKIVARGDTTVADAYLTPVLRSYLDQLRDRLGAGSSLHLLTSAGGLVAADRFHGKDSILSGPAGGVVGFSRVGENAGFPGAIGFDMGGTSTDVSRFDGQFELEYETEKAGVRVVAPMLAIETVAAGGGSICGFDGAKLVVGPDSAGAEPGPACYGRGGPLTVTDLNFWLGRIRADYFPFPLDRQAVADRIYEMIDTVHSATGRRYAPAELAEGFLHIANAKMASAIRSISIAKGYDPREYVLVAFGGAAAQHACAVADELGIRQILNHPDASVLSALGIGLANVVRHHAKGLYRRLSPDDCRAADEPARSQHSEADTSLAEIFASLSEIASRELTDEGYAADQIQLARSLELRYEKTDAAHAIVEPPDGDWQAAFEKEHRRLYGYACAGRPVEIVTARVQVTGRGRQRLVPSRRVRSRPITTDERIAAVFAGGEQDVALLHRNRLRPGDLVAGPAIIVEPLSTTVIEPDWQAEVMSGGELLLERVPADTNDPAASSHGSTAAVEPDPVLLEIFNNHFAAIAEQMGITLRNTATSVNVKERLDFSCAVFNAGGDLVVNAPHIPVHLGAMSETVRHVIADNPKMRPGDVYVTNDPYRGGSHLPDITVVTPVHASESGELLFFTASRAHHAEIGGIAPGSMPPFSRTLAEEGVVIRNFRLIGGDAGAANEPEGETPANLVATEELRSLLLSGSHPSRAVEDNLADIAAQVAANRQGVTDLLRLVTRYSLPRVAAYMDHIQAAAERKMRAALERLGEGDYTFTDHLDDGSPISVRITIAAGQAIIDFAGTGSVLPGNLNANRAIVTAAVMYVFRCLIDEDIPLNQGVLTPVEIRLPECLLNPPDRGDPSRCAAVVGGNVETSQRVVDVLLGALRLAAASQGTMNNLLFGDATFGYYETICGGAGATAAADGADAVHTHMTNTRLTDPEVLERRFPVRLREFAIRPWDEHEHSVDVNAESTLGPAEYRGGRGVIRRLEFLRPLQVSILSQRRGPYPPFGLHGGSPGALGRNTLERVDGTVESVAGQARLQVAAGDVLTIETPGGGGYGRGR